MDTTSVEILKAGTIDGKDYEKGDKAKLTPFQRKIAAREGMVEAAEPESVAETSKTAAKKGTTRKRTTR